MNPSERPQTTEELLHYNEPGDEVIPEDSRDYTRWTVERYHDPDYMNQRRAQVAAEFTRALTSLSDQEVEQLLVPKHKAVGREYGHLLNSASAIERERIYEVLDYAFGWPMMEEYLAERQQLKP